MAFVWSPTELFRGGGSLEVIGVGSKEETSGENLMKDNVTLSSKVSHLSSPCRSLLKTQLMCLSKERELTTNLFDDDE